MSDERPKLNVPLIILGIVAILMFAIVIPAIKIPSRQYISQSDAASITTKYKLTPNLIISLIKENGECFLITNQSSTKINIVCE